MAARQAHTGRVVATDVNETTLEIARKKEYGDASVIIENIDAYDLTGLVHRVEAVFAADWFSHVPKHMLPPFLERMHRRIGSGAPVVFLDQMPYIDPDGGEVWSDAAGNRLHRRTLPDGAKYTVVKNFPEEPELRSLLEGKSEQVRFIEDESLRRWLLTYLIK